MCSYSFHDFIDYKLQSRLRDGLLRNIVSSDRDVHDNKHILRDGKKVLSFGCNDYFGCASNKNLISAAKNALENHGLGASASCVLSGSSTMYSILEKNLADYRNKDAACVFGSGYLANLGTISSLMERNDLLLLDKHVHASAIDGSMLSHAKLLRFKHNCIDSLVKILKHKRSDYEKCLIIVDHVYTMTGDIAPIEKIIEITKIYNCTLLVDDAHGIGIVDLPKGVDIIVGTLSKAIGCYGGYVCASDNVIKFLNNYARSFIFSTALPTCILAAANAGLDIVRNSDKTPLKNAQLFSSLLGISTAQTNIVPIKCNSNEDALLYSKMLYDNGFYVPAIRRPTVETPRLRFSFSTKHSVDDIKSLAEAVKSLLKNEYLE